MTGFNDCPLCVGSGAQCEPCQNRRLLAGDGDGELVRKARFVYNSLLERRIVGAETLTRYAIDLAAHVLAHADGNRPEGPKGARP